MSADSPDTTLRFGEKSREAKAAVILVHGRGSNPREIGGITRLLPSKGIRFYAPGAADGTWYPQRFLAPLDDNEPALSIALGTLDLLVEEILAEGIPLQRIGFIGFSQGACLSLEYVSRTPARYGFVAGLSGALIGPLDTPRADGDLSGTPVLLGCAEADAHIPLPYVEQSARVLTGQKAEVTTVIFPGSTHSVFHEELDWLKPRMSALSA